jgi:hypothetical protein
MKDLTPYDLLDVISNNYDLRVNKPHSYKEALNEIKELVDIYSESGIDEEGFRIETIKMIEKIIKDIERTKF